MAMLSRVDIAGGRDRRHFERYTGGGPRAPEEAPRAAAETPQLHQAQHDQGAAARER